jgi:hypothetical protein
LLDHRENADILGELNAHPVKKIVQYKENWLHHVSKMKDIRYPKQFLTYWPNRRLGQPLKSLLDG